MKSIVTILFLVATIASTVCAGDNPSQEVIMARRDAERAARQAVAVANSKIALIPGIPKAELKSFGGSPLDNQNFVSFMREQNDLLRQQNAILLRIADVVAPVASTNVVQKLEKE